MPRSSHGLLTLQAQLMLLLRLFASDLQASVTIKLCRATSSKTRVAMKQTLSNRCASRTAAFTRRTLSG